MCTKYTIIAAIIFFFSLTSLAKVEAPNYNFSLDQLIDFFPDKSFEELQQKRGKAELHTMNGQVPTYKYYVEQIHYKFPVYFQVYQGKILDFYAKLPSYFLHDVFHQSLLNRFGKQDKYLKKANHATYIWKNKNNALLLYQGGCTIQCFSVFFTAITTQSPEGLGEYRPLLFRFIDAQELSDL